MSSDTDRIRLPDSGLQQIIDGGTAVITPGIAALGSLEVKRLFQTISVFDDYCAVKERNLSGQFHDFDFDGKKVLFRIDYCHQPVLTNSTKLEIKTRTISIMLADEV